jgi:NDP-sugar pyrophosphorylase family protein
MTPPTLLILAAGMASRYAGLKLDDSVGPNNETIMDYSIYDARRAGFGKIVFVIRPELEERFRKEVATRLVRHVPIEFVHQHLTKLPPGYLVPRDRTKPWGTTQAILAAAHVIHEPFAVINVDDLYGAESYRSLFHYLQSGPADYAIMGFVLRNTLFEFGTAARGICHVSSNGYLEGIEELENVERVGGHAVSIGEKGQETRLTGDEITSMNMWGFTPQIFDQLNDEFERFLKKNGEDLNAECSIPNTMTDLIRSGKAHVKVLQCSDPWIGITYRDDQSRAIAGIHRLIESGYYPMKLW